MIKAINVISDSNIGGAGRMLLTFMRNYDRKRIDMTVLLPSGAMLIPELESLGIRCITDPGLSEKSYDASATKRLKRLFKDEKPDIVHTHASMSARIAAKSIGCKIVYSRHSVFPNSALKTHFPLKQVFGFINNHYADAVIAVSPAAAELLIEAGQDPQKVSVIYNGVDPLRKPDEEQRKSIRSEYNLGESDFVCGIFARLTPVKGHEYILQAASHLKHESNIKFVIAGTGEIENELIKQANEMDLRNVVFSGFLSDVEGLMSACDLQLNASYGTEATSLALLEGMSIGIPAIASSFGGNPYVISHGENGFIVPERDAKALSDAISDVYRDNELYSVLSGNAVMIFNDKFTAAKMTSDIETLYFELLCDSETTQ